MRTKLGFVIVYLSLGGIALFYGEASQDLASLGVPDAAISLGSKLLDATLKTLGSIAVAVLGLEALPKLPGRDTETK